MPVALTPGTRLGHYEIIAAIGAGGMGAVYRARDPRLDREVAIKVLSPDVALDAGAPGRFEREAMSVAKLSHPNILAIFEFAQDGGTAFVVTELLDGETLRARLERGALPSRRAIAYALQIARGIAAAHARGIVHRDLKPENVMITLDDQVKILDFGIAKAVETTDSDMTRGATNRRHGPGNGRLHGAGTSPCPGGGSSRGHVRFRRGALRDAERRACVQRGNRRGHDDGDPDEGSARPRRGAVVHLPQSRPHRPSMPREDTRSPVSVGQRSRLRSRDPVNRIHVLVRRRRRGSPSSSCPHGVAAVDRRGNCLGRGCGFVAVERCPGTVRTSLGFFHADQRVGGRGDVADALARWHDGGLLDARERKLGHLFAARRRAECHADCQRSAAQRGRSRLLPGRVADRISRIGRCGRCLRRRRDGRVGAEGH